MTYVSQADARVSQADARQGGVEPDEALLPTLNRYRVALPIALVIFGLVASFAWVIFLAWYALRLILR
jgi:hypothetical protein